MTKVLKIVKAIPGRVFESKVDRIAREEANRAAQQSAGQQESVSTP